MNKLMNHKGLSLGEILVSVAIVALVSIGMLTGVILSNNQLTKQMRLSQANELYTTLSSLISNELRYTKEVDLKGNTNTVDTFFSVTYALKEYKTGFVSLDEEGQESNGYGDVALGSDNEYNRIIGSAAYGQYDLGAKVDSFTYDSEKEMFTVTLDIGVKNGDSILKETFHVRAINTPTVNVS